MTRIYEGERTPNFGGPERDAGRSSTAPVHGRGDFLDQLSNAARKNPASAALISMGVVWLFMGGSKVTLFRGGTDKDRRTPAYPTHDRFQVVHRPSPSPSSSAHAATDTLAPLGSRVGDSAIGAGSVASDAVSAAVSQTSEALSSAGSSAYGASQAASKATLRAAEDMQRNLSDLFERQPLVLGAIGMAVGASLAAALPRTQMESRVMGEASDAAKAQAGSLASDQLSDVGKLADWALQEITREVRAQGLSMSAVTDVVRSFVEKAASSAPSADTPDRASEVGASSTKP